MKRSFDNKLTDTIKAEQARLTELAMLRLLIEKHPREAQKKAGEMPTSKRFVVAENWQCPNLAVLC